ncbi:MAG: iron ABC transporter ATP-binding protein [Firmicutes bacterium HGW-Firmicutes-15]|nr:MAG: iron ABC transporter ATP-binding protein [Firmicutes bacterium HGW-Firmicutes-15]
MKLEISEGSFGYTKDNPVFKNIYLDLEDNQFLCLLGQNGCGKTTLLKCLAGMMPLSSGEVRINGKHLASMTRRETALAIGYVPQDQETAFPFSVEQMVLVGRAPSLNFFSSPSAQDMAVAEEAMERVGILRLKDQRYTELSGGERQLVLIARVLAQQPNILLLDEPTSHLDFKNQTIILRLIRDLVREGRSVIMTTHYPNHAFIYPNRVALMHNGKILVIGTPGEVLLESNLSQAYGIDVCLYSAHDKSNNKLVTFCAPVEESV